MRKITLTLLFFVLFIFIANTCIFILDETEQAVITQLGKPIRTITTPGLKWKIPFIQQVRIFEKRLLEYDVDPEVIYTRDGKNLVVDNYARWRIKDPLLFYQTAGAINAVQAKLDDIIYSEMRAQLGKYTLDEIISPKRQQIMEVVTQESNLKAASLGIEIVDVRIKRADLPPENASSVYARMKASRQQEANRYRAEGEEEANRIISEADKEQQIILAEAQQRAQEIRGEGDAEALQIYAEAYNKDPEFYQFLKTLETYEKALDKDTTIILDNNSDFLKYLENIYENK
ncbi:HflC protein [Anoxybacter fermentans]|uniref:Protein HflC n=1 Tax=Anoxybacter fermentans TaxID=1323375 RepID=A0A3Q9HR19_9FIRM|nr:protease modulator HflC [Anoxybacter fermentans]AZR73635.1 HflC protein [Anoxybacter fermentans]